MIGSLYNYGSLALRLALLLSVPVVSELTAGEKMELRVGFLVESERFDKVYSEKDIKLATQVLFSRILERGGDLDTTFTSFRRITDYVEAIGAGELDYIEMNPLLFLRLPEAVRQTVKPLSVVQIGERRLERFVLLAKPGATLESLSGKRLRIDVGTDRGISAVWLNYELQEDDCSVLEDHFGRVEIYRKSEQVLLPTFFGKADTCMVREADYAIAVELNPQIGQRLVPVVMSPEFPLIMTAAAGPNADEVKSRIGSNPDQIANNPGTQQAFALLRIKGISAYRETDLDALREIVEAVEKKSTVTAVEQPDEDK